MRRMVTVVRRRKPVEPVVPEDRLLHRREAAAYLAMAPSTLAKMAVFGTGPTYVKMGRSVRYRRSALDAWLAERETTGVEDGVKRGIDTPLSSR